MTSWLHSTLPAPPQVLEELPSLVDVPIPEGSHINVCGDTHGQFYDLLNIFETHGRRESCGRETAEAQLRAC